MRRTRRRIRGRRNVEHRDLGRGERHRRQRRGRIRHPLRPRGEVTALAKRSPFLAILAGGLLLRVLLAFVLFPKQGFSTDMQLFASWATTLARVGPGSFYATATGADYPPGYLYILWLLGNAPASALPLLLKVPAILADLGIALVIYVAARRWLGERAGLIAAALYLFIPVNWYDSALWGQVDAVGALLLIASLVLLIEKQSEAAIALAVLAILVKPQEAVALVVVLPVLVVAGGLLVRDGRVPILLGFAIVAFAFYAVPTRVHERYLFPFFTAGALLAAEFVAASVSYLVVGALNAINLHAVLAAPLSITGLGRSAGPGLGRAGGGFRGVRPQLSAIRLPFGGLRRSGVVGALVVLGQTAALLALL